MTTNDELVRLRKAFAAPAGPVPEPEACPPSDRIWLGVRGELPPYELREIVDHVATCSACAEDWRVAMAFEEESRAANTADTDTGTLRYRSWMAVAATLLVAVLGYQGYQFRTRTPTPPPGYRSGQGQTVESTMVENTRLPRQHFTLYWRGIPEAASYNLTITAISEDTMTPLHEAKGLTATTYTVPESDLASVRSGTKILWTVTPVSRDGGQLPPRTSRAFVIDLPQ
jgi:hypothetical protein